MTTEINTVSELAKALLELFGPNGDRWCRYTPAIDRKGRAVFPMSRDAAAWCLIGGAQKLGGREPLWRQRYLDILRKQIPHPGFFNDRHTWPEIKEFLEKLAKGE